MIKSFQARLAAPKTTVVFYHRDCIDGALAAVAAYHEYGDNAEFIGIDHSDRNLLAHITKALGNGPKKNVVFADVGPQNKESLNAIAALANQVLIVEHHKTVLDFLEETIKKGELPTNVTLHTDLTKSGARLAYEHFITKMPVKDHELPAAIRLAEKSDLNRLSTEEDHHVAAYVDSLPKSNIHEAIAAYHEINRSHEEGTLAQKGAASYAELERRAQHVIDRREYQQMDFGHGLESVVLVKANVRHLPRKFADMLFEQTQQDGISPRVALIMARDRDNTGDDRHIVSIRRNGELGANEVAKSISAKVRELIIARSGTVTIPSKTTQEPKILPRGFMDEGGGHPDSASLRLSPSISRTLLNVALPRKPEYGTPSAPPQEEIPVRVLSRTERATQRAWDQRQR